MEAHNSEASSTIMPADYEVAMLKRINHSLRCNGAPTNSELAYSAGNGSGIGW